MNTHPALLGPVIALVLWTGVIWLWMYATRIPAVFKARMQLDPMAPRGQQMSQLPPHVRWKADNFNHLLEIPTLFYAVVLSLAMLGDTSSASLYLAWAYVALRVVHSLHQCLSNIIKIRFALFAASSLLLFWLAVRAALIIFAA
jgi:hypothetical protein